MSKILKANRISVDSDNKINIEVPVFKSNIHNEDDKSKSFKSVNHEIAFEDFDELSLTDEYDEQDELSLNSYFDTENDVSSDFEFDEGEKAVSNANEEAAKIIDNAKAEAMDIIDDAIQTAEIRKSDIFENARQEGYAAGVSEAEEQTAEMKEEALRVLENARREREDMLENAESDMVDLMINVIDKILCKALDLDKSVILNLVRQGFSQTTVTGNVFVRVSDDDYDSVNENKDEIFNMIDSNVKLELIKDMTLGKGDCIIETPFGNIDCGLKQQFEGLKNSLYYVLENG
ncbi:MAG: hypothetical protein HFE59_00165 [Clostridiales bacterium]|nr:hypothetical protein [Clostridiales bacterium]